MGILAPSQATFAAQLAHDTGLNPRLVAAWTLAEESGSAAHSYEARRYNDWLNIANTDSGPAHGAHSSVWSDPQTAAHATADWLKGHGQITQEYGRAAPGILAIMHTAHLGPTSQISAIAHSGWASSGYNGGATLQELYGQLGGERLPEPTAGPTPTIGSPAGSMGVTRQLYAKAFDQGGFEHAERVAAANRILTEGKGMGALRGILPTSVSPAAFASTTHRTAHISGESVPHTAVPGGSWGGFVEQGAHVEQKRRDQGRDLQLQPGAALLASGDGVVVGVKSDPKGFGPAYPIVHFTSGPDAGKTIYFGHVDTAVREGEHVHLGNVIAHTSRTGHNAPPGWVEIGLAEGGTPGPFGQPLPTGL